MFVEVQYCLNLWSTVTYVSIFKIQDLNLHLWNFHELSLQSQVRQDQTHEFQDHG